MGIKITTPQTSEPISLADAKRHLRIAPTATREDTEIQGWIASARREAERISGLALAARTVQYTFDAFPSWELWLPMPPLVSVLSIKYYDTTGTLQTLATTEYSVISTRIPGFIEPSYDASIWPTPRDISDACQVNFVAGHPVTTVAAAISAGSQTVTPASMAGIIAGSVLMVDVGSKQEQVAVASVTATTFTATFAQAHSDLPIVINCVPEDIRNAMLLIVESRFRNRGSEDVPIPRAVFDLLDGASTGTYMGVA